MTNAIAFPAAFQDKLRDALFEKFMELFPKEQLDKAIADEIDAYFNSNVGEFTQATLQIPAPTEYNSRNTRSVEVLKTFTPISPFRQLVWSSLHNHLKPILAELLKDRATEFHKALLEHLTQELPLNASIREQTRMLGVAMSSSMVSSAMLAAQQAAHENLKRALLATGMDYNMVNSMPCIQATHVPTVGI